MSNINNSYNLTQKLWFDSPKQGHLVQFYNDSYTLHKSLSQYFSIGLQKNEVCIAIAKPEVVEKVELELVKNGFNIARLRQDRQFITLDAENTLKQFMVDGRPDWELFDSIVGELVRELEGKNQNIRAFGEMVAILWKQGKAEAVMKLEEFWNELGKRYNFALFCAYPLITFDTCQHLDEIKYIHKLHSHSYPVYQTFAQNLNPQLSVQ